MPIPPIFFPRFSSFFLSGSISLPVPDNLVDYSVDGFSNARLLQLTLPNDDDAPPFRLQLPPDILISHLIPSDLSNPELRVSLGNSIILAAFVAMPETAVNENDGSMLWKNYVWTAWKTLGICSVTKSPMP